jgi:histone-lysine N-methyltransferase SETMAR
MMHKNASSHKAAIVQECLKQENNFVELPHPPYSPHLTLVTFSYFLDSKNHLARRKYQMRKNVGSAIFQCLKSIPRKDYENTFKNWIKGPKVCISHGGEHFEGLTLLFWHCLLSTSEN